MKTSPMVRPGRTGARRGTARGLAAAVLVAAAATLGAASAGAAASTTTVVDQPPISLQAFVPCANGGAGETVTLTGTLHVQTTFTASAGGTYLVTSQFNPQGVSGVGSTSGTKYLATGLTRSTYRYYPGQIETYINRFHIVGAAGESLYVKETYHYTITPDGTLRTVVDNSSYECR